MRKEERWPSVERKKKFNSRRARVSRLNFTVQYILKPESVLHWLLHRCEVPPFLTGLHVIGLHNCQVFIYWRGATQGVSDKVWSNDELIANVRASAVYTPHFSFTPAFSDILDSYWLSLVAILLPLDDDELAATLLCQPDPDIGRTSADSCISNRCVSFLSCQASLLVFSSLQGTLKNALSCGLIADLLSRSRLVRHRSRVREALGLDGAVKLSKGIAFISGIVKNDVKVSELGYFGLPFATRAGGCETRRRGISGGMQGWEKRECPEKTRWPKATSATFPKCEHLGDLAWDSNPDSPRWEASVLQHVDWFSRVSPVTTLLHSGAAPCSPHFAVIRARNTDAKNGTPITTVTLSNFSCSDQALAERPALSHLQTLKPGHEHDCSNTSQKTIAETPSTGQAADQEDMEMGLHASRREHCTPVHLSLALSGDGALEARGKIALITLAFLSLKRRKLSLGRRSVSQPYYVIAGCSSILSWRSGKTRRPIFTASSECTERKVSSKPNKICLVQPNYLSVQGQRSASFLKPNHFVVLIWLSPKLWRRVRDVMVWESLALASRLNPASHLQVKPGRRELHQLLREGPTAMIPSTSQRSVTWTPKQRPDISQHEAGPVVFQRPTSLQGSLLVSLPQQPLEEMNKVWSSAEMKGRWETGYPRRNPPTSGIVRHDAPMRKSGNKDIRPIAKMDCCKCAHRILKSCFRVNLFGMARWKEKGRGASIKVQLWSRSVAAAILVVKDLDLDLNLGVLSFFVTCDGTIFPLAFSENTFTDIPGLLFTKALICLVVGHTVDSGTYVDGTVTMQLLQLENWIARLQALCQNFLKKKLEILEAYKTQEVDGTAGTTHYVVDGDATKGNPPEEVYDTAATTHKEVTGLAGTTSEERDGTAVDPISSRMPENKMDAKYDVDCKKLDEMTHISTPLTKNW
ncbi:hypothetical protein PR048_024010 [Dryococelus australis]|uniref:Uncharacterized protein n=1 Tax=Dryococelus australis TaxID=614101 RepID=A0ABQ9GVP7_9NEOP|nr:hypothetical protein PR048_024010 [Dryococelus australis]